MFAMHLINDTMACYMGYVFVLEEVAEFGRIEEQPKKSSRGKSISLNRHTKGTARRKREAATSTPN